MSEQKFTHFDNAQIKLKTLREFETLFMRASIYMTLSQKIEKIGIYSVAGEILSYEVDGKK